MMIASKLQKIRSINKREERNTKWKRAKEEQIQSQIQTAKTIKINGTLKMKTGIKKASTFWYRFVPEVLKIEREMKFDSFENIQLQVRKRRVFGIIRTA